MNPIRSTAAVGFILKTLITQILAASATIILWPFLESFSTAVIMATIITFIGAKILQLPPAWQIANLLLPLAASISISNSFPAWIFLVIFGLLAMIYAPAIWTRVPYYPTPREAYSIILAELPTEYPFKFVDIGCGFADLLMFLSKHRPNGEFVGIELGPLPWFVSTLRGLINRRGNLSIQFKDMWKLSLSEFNVVYTFLSPAAMDRIWLKACDEMLPDTTFITNSFPVPATPDEVIRVKDIRNSNLYIHHMRFQKKMQGNSISASRQSPC